jgi:hypothetical protein
MLIVPDPLLVLHSIPDIVDVVIPSKEIITT